MTSCCQERTTDTFAVEVVPAAVSLPPKVEAGSEDIDKEAMAIDCFHFNTLTQGQVGRECKQMYLYSVLQDVSRDFNTFVYFCSDWNKHLEQFNRASRQQDLGLWQ